ncbi:MAG: putative Ig domain-containing protein [Gammaproteobacteria bacterium]|nr:putative Ig domain-containing protein [Gammaproteobacteria bacterium]
MALVKLIKNINFFYQAIGLAILLAFSSITLAQQSCPAGQGFDILTNQCEKCPRGMYNPGGLLNCKSCELGTYSSDFGSAKCTQCDIGTYAPTVGSLVCTVCTTAIVQAGASQCPNAAISSSGPAGFSAAVSTPIKFDIARYYTTTLQDSPTYSLNPALPELPTGLTLDKNTGIISGTVDNSTSGTASVMVSIGSGTLNIPITFAIGNGSSGSGSGGGAVSISPTATAERCAIGFYSPTGTNQSQSCSLCPANTTNIIVGSTMCSPIDTSSIGTPCSQNFYSPTGTDQPTGCQQCPTGYSNVGMGGTMCTLDSQPTIKGTPCKSGDYSPTGTDNPTLCLPCPNGTTNGLVGMSRCGPAQSNSPPTGSAIQCLNNTYSQNGSGFAPCEPCPNKWVTPGPGATSISECTACGNGNIESPEACDLGTIFNGKGFGCALDCTVDQTSNWKCVNPTSTPHDYKYWITDKANPDSLYNLYRDLTRSYVNPILTTPPQGPGYRIDTGTAESYCNPIQPGWGEACKQYTKDIIQFKQLNNNNSIATAFNDPTGQSTFCDKWPRVFDITASPPAPYQIKCMPDAANYVN